MIFRPHILLVSVILLGMAGHVCAVEDIKVPFNFQWGESPQRLLQRALFYFDNDSLNEIELHYGEPSWDSTQFGNFFDQTRRNIESKYGIGRVIARQKTREGDVLQTLIGYQWTQDSVSLTLFYYTAERDADSYRVLSLHYRGF